MQSGFATCGSILGQPPRMENHLTGSGQHHPTEGPVTRQVDIYGFSWADRLGALMATYRLSQARLAAVIGLSPPMVSQLISGQRVKISNPAVYGRVVRLEELAQSPAVLSGTVTDIDHMLADVTASAPMLTTVAVPVAGQPAPEGREQVVAFLTGIATAADLRATAAASPSAELARVLGEAAERAG